MARFSSSQAVEADLFAGEIDFGSNESMGPEGINEVAMAEQFEFTALIGAAQEDDHSPERALQVERPVVRKSASLRSGVEAWCCATTSGVDEAPRAVGQGGEILVLKASPDFVLPAAVVVLDGRLEAGLSRRGEDRSDVELETKSRDASEGIGPLMGALEDRVVVELDVPGKSVFAPVLDEHFDREFGSPGGFDPTGTEATMQADAIEDHDVGSTTNDEPFHEVEAVELDLTGCDAWQIPPLGRGRAADSSASIQGTTPEENSADGAQGGDALDAALLESSMNGSRAELSEVAGLLELFAEPQDEILEMGRRSASGPSSTAWRITPDHPIKSLTAGTSNPVLNGSQTDMKFPLNISERSSTANRRNHPPPSRFNTVFRSQSVPAW